MKAGDKIRCPQCGETTFLQKKAVMEDWKVVGHQLVCSFCGAVVVKDADAEEQAPAPKEEGNARLDALRALLGEKEPEKRPVWEEKDKRFCRDCKWSIHNPFGVICTKKEEEVQPMDDCQDFTPRKQDK